MNQQAIISKHIGNLLCRDNISVGNLLGIQSQFLRYSKWVAKVRGVNLDVTPGMYFRAWTLRGTMHIHEMEDYPLYMHEGNRSSYMCEYWNDHSIVSVSAKRKAEDEMLRLIEGGTTSRKEIIRSFQESGMPKEEIDYLFNSWGGLPRILMERGEIVQTISDDLSYTFVPKISVMTAEQAELEQMKRYIENYAPCSISDAIYFFRFTKSKAKKLMSQCVSSSSGTFYWEDDFIFKEADNVCNQAEINSIHILPGFDPLLVGYEKKENTMVPSERLRAVFNLQGIIKPVIIHKGKCIAIWTVRKNIAYISPFDAGIETMSACKQSENKIRELVMCDECRYE